MWGCIDWWKCDRIVLERWFAAVEHVVFGAGEDNFGNKTLTERNEP